jgi:tetratricopeptide (TPR) repeat protein
MLGWWLAAALAVSPQAPADAVAPPPPIPIPTPEQVFAIPPELDARLAQALGTDRAAPRERLDRLVTFIAGDAGMGLRYEGNATLTVSEAYAAHQGNCLTWTIVFVALAQRAGLEAHAQEVTQTLNWYQQEHTVYLNSHVNAVVKVGRSRMVVDVSGNDVIGREPPFVISRQRLVSHYYNNRAIALLAANDIGDAERFSARALALAPDHADHWSNAGVIRVRNGDIAGAIAAYTRALALDPRNASALFNSVILAHKVGDSANEARLRARLERVQRDDPFHQFLRGLELENRGQLAEAITHYRIAARLYPDEHRFHAALARACLGAGDLRCAMQALHRARSVSQGQARAAYQAQLDALRADRLRHADGGSRRGRVQR